jgi:hypothetical protein
MLGPRRKFRGQRRHFRRVHQRAAAFRLSTEAGAWWSMWHHHADMRGWGNLRWSWRREHLRALATVFRSVAAAIPACPVPVQAWLLIDADAGQDAVFVHSPNPNGDAFPWTEAGPWSSEGPVHDLLADLLPGLQFRVCQQVMLADVDAPGPRRRVGCIAYCPGIGVSLEGLAQAR